ncbi:LINE-1 retrotransposable element ORF2 protein [Vitis vinifera]|uniref:LINE-1 retrotransposable element ORF2 protein n=1 Tax=Vitis vinifera TaxID=29760 RepID=A0A438G0U0_VITVI|nr:LINE-1 retrotransposable element ORF2 protein [Vitis vinifera]
MEYVRSWALKHWALKGNLRVATLGRGFLLFDFEIPDEAERVLARGMRIFKENVLVLERWNPEVGCLRKEPTTKDVWVRVIGLPLHLRSSEVFKRIGDECGGFIAADESSLNEMQWARLMVRCVDREMPSTAHIVVGSGCYSLQLWWESSPWFTQVVPAGSFSGEGSLRVGEEAGGTVRELSRGSQREKVEQLRLQQGESVVSAGGGVSDLCPAVLYEAGDEVEGRVGSAEWTGPDAAEGGDLNGEGFSSPRARAQSPGAEKGSGDADSLVLEDPIVDNLRAASQSVAFAVPKMTDQALRDEASRYVGLPSVGGREISPSSLSSGIDRAGTNEGVSSGLISEIEGEEQLPLSIILADGCNGEMGPGGRDPRCLARFSKFLGFSTEGFEGEILNLLLRNKRRREQNIKKDISGSTKFDRELKKLEWSINYKGARKEKSLETKIQDISRGIVHSLGVGRFLGWGAMSARGAAGGVVVFWDNRVLELMGMEVQTGPFSDFGGLGESLQWGVSVFPPKTGIRSLPNLVRWGRDEERSNSISVREYVVEGGGVQGAVEGLVASLWQSGVNKGLALDKVSFWDNQEQFRALNEQELEARKEAREEFKKWALMEETSWRQKSREIWLKEGDKNTGFFHKMANSNRRRNCLKKIKINGTWLSEEHDIQRGVVRAFKDLLSDSGGWRPCCNNIEFDSIGDEEVARLEECFSGDEVFLALSDLNGDKAPGPDGFSLAFWQFCWDFVKDEVLGFFKEFYERGKFVRSLNTTFLVLIPKKCGAEDLSDFRPISLVGGLYKLLAKVLANRLKKVVGKVVSSSQNAFVEVLQRMGFGEKWIGWIRWCISTASFSVLVNGSPTGFFRSSRGLRQGDPLSPYLFVLGMEALSSLINRAVRGGFLSGCRIGGREGVGIQVTHLLFADDTLVFCDDSQEQVAFLSWLLMWFEATSGLRINLNKSEILPVGCVENAELLAAELGCKVGSLPSTYLGLPLGASHKSVKVWDGVEERMRKKLALWKRQFISKGGRLTLIRRGALEKRPHLVKWAVVCTHKKMGGLGIRNLSILNRALLCKWSWRYAVERDSYWKLIISTKYGVDRGGWSTCGAREGHGVGLWKEISKEGLLLLNNVSFSVGDGRRCVGCGLLGSNGGSGRVDSSFLRPFNDWEVEEAERLLSSIQGKRVDADGEDRMLWRGTKNEIFTVKSLYKSLDHSYAVSFPGNIIWSPYVPSKVSFFAWEASWEKVLTQDQLKRKGWILANRCCLCCVEEETINHILVHCSKTKMLWDLLLSLFGVNWVMPFSVRDTLLSWYVSFKDKKHRKVSLVYSLYALGCLSSSLL